MSNRYDEVLYAGLAFAQTHPDRLATIARLFGMRSPSVERCRVLELGCGDGGNLIPMAYTLPGSEFVGVDLGARGIAGGREMASALELRNVTLRCLDILEAGADLGKFDYILAHGVYSWVPPAVQEGILTICRENLNPHGVAYISYSVYPGAHLRAMTAEMLQYHARRFSQPDQQIDQARALLGFLATAHPAQDVYTLILQQEVNRIAGRRAQSLYHDDLEECHSALYFHEFAERAARHGLQYLGEADFFEMQDSAEPPEVSSMLRKLARDPIDKEQYLDFLKCRRFRQTLLCHAQVPLKRHIDSSQMREFYVARRKSDVSSTPTEHPVAKAAMEVLTGAWPAALSFDDLLDGVRARATYPEDDLLLADVVLAFFACGLFQLHTRPPQFTRSVSEYPRASAVARYQAPRDAFVTNLCHHVVHMEDDPSRRLLAALDGTRNRAALLEAVGFEALEVDLERSLEGLARAALLEG